MKLPLTPSIRAELAGSEATPDASILSHFQDIPDFRREHGRRHLLLDILVIAACAIIADCNGPEEIAEYGIDNETWLRTFLELPNGIPSHDTFRRVLLHLAPAPFQRACVSWLLVATARLRQPQPIAAALPADVLPTTAAIQPSGPATDLPAPPPTVLPSTPTEVLLPAEFPPSPLGDDNAPAASPTLPEPACLAGHLAGPSGPADSQSQQSTRAPDIEAAATAVAALPGATALPLAAQAAATPMVGSREVEPEQLRRHWPVDGKTLRGSLDKRAEQAALHLVSIWDSEERLSLGQVAVEGKSNEITAIPQVLSLVDLAGAVVSIDAIGTQAAIVAQIRDGRGDYLLAVKLNQLHLYEDVVASFARYFEQQDGQPDRNQWVEVSKGEHGRKEKRTYLVIDDVSGIRDPEKWRDVKRLIMVLRECEKSDGTWQEEIRYYIGSAACGVRAYAKWVRDHWGIENRLHWLLDVVFHEDASRMRKDHGTENLAMLRRLAVSLLGNDRSFKRSIKGKRKKAARDNQYLARVLLGLPDSIDPLNSPKTAPPA